MIKPFNTLLGAIKYYATNMQDKLALVEGISDKKVTYAEFWKKIHSYASFLTERGLKKGDRVTLLTAQTIDYLSAYYGVMLAGGTAVPVDPTVSEEKLCEIAEYFKSTFISSAKFEKTLSFREQPGELHNFSLPNDDELAVILYTTGTTGKSKGVLSSYRCRFCGADNVSQYYDITPNDTALVPQVLSHSGGLRRVEAMFVSGGTVVVMGSTMMFGDVFNALKKHNCTILQLVPAQVAQILRSAEKLLISANEQLRVLSVGSAVIPEVHKERLREILPKVRLFNDFGSTEAIGSAYFEWSAFPMKAGCVGTEAVHSRIVFLDDDGNVLEHTTHANPGIIATEGGTLMSGYWDEPELTAELLQDKRLISTDLGYRGDDGMIYIVGRKTDVIVSGANKISPFEVENAVLQIDGVKECAVLGKPDDIMGQLPALFVVAANDKELSASMLIESLSKSLERYKIPRYENIIFLTALPKTEGTGKVIRKQLEGLLCEQ